MKKTVKLVLAFFIGILIGLCVATACVGLFSDMTMAEFVHKLVTADVLETTGVVAFSIVAFVVSFFLQIIIHETGHLVFGLLSGYKFVSFRILNFTLLRRDGRMVVKKFGIAGTGGQCLLLPPDIPVDRLPIFWYMAGGVIFNLIVTIIVIVFFFVVDLHPLFAVFLSLFALAGVFLVLTNGIPLKLGGMSNDAMELKVLSKNKDARRIICAMLNVNAMVQNGVLPREMPEEYFQLPETLEFKDIFTVQIYIMRASRMLDMELYDEAYSMFKTLVERKKDILGVFYNEAACELMYLALLRGEQELVGEIFDKQLETYITQYAKVMSSKQRVLCAKALLMEQDEEKALNVYDSLKKVQNNYLMQGEVKSDLLLMDAMFKMKGVNYGQ